MRGLGWTTLVAAAFLCVTQAKADGVRAGTLSCHVSGGWGFVLGSSKDLRCEFAPIKGMDEHYIGTVSKFGVDIGYTTGGVIVWDVVAPETGLERGALSGSYAGATASLTAGVGLGANVLVGGFHHSVALQPLSIEGNTGLNIAAGIGSIDLRFASGEREIESPSE